MVDAGFIPEIVLYDLFIGTDLELLIGYIIGYKKFGNVMATSC